MYRLCVLMPQSFIDQGVGGELAKGDTETQRYDWYKLVYYLVEQQLDAGRCVPQSPYHHEAAIHLIVCCAPLAHLPWLESVSQPR